MMSQTIQCPPFPDLALSSWNVHGAELRGTGTLPQWASIQADSGPNLVGDSGDGSFCLTVNTPPEANNSPTNEQITAYSYLLEHGSSIVNASLKSIFDEYIGMREDYIDCLPANDAERLAPELENPSDILPLISLGTMTVHSIHKDNSAYIGISFSCTWDREHGLGVLTHRSRVVSVGGADTSFLEWIARSDLKDKT